MRKFIAIILSVLLCFGCGACMEQGVSQEEYNKVVSERDSLQSEKDALQREIDILVAKPEPTPESISTETWELQYYVDAFNEPTEESYITPKEYFVGTFSNSATTNSKLYATILIDKDDIAIILYEYGSNKVKNASSRNNEKYDIIMKTEDDEKTNFKGEIYTGGDRIVITSTARLSVINALSGNGDVSFYIVESDRTTTNYLFSVPVSNFTDAYKFLTLN